MKLPRIQFTIRNILWATIWAGVWFALLRLTDFPRSDFGSPLFPVWRYSSCIVAIFGVLGVARQRPIAWGLLALGAWIILTVLLLPPIQAARE